MNTKIVPVGEALVSLYNIVKESTEPSIGLWFGMLFAGDRASCCDEAAVVCNWRGKLAAVATIAPEGEAGSGTPTIVGLYTLPKFRGQGFGKAVMETAIRRMQERGFSKIRVDALTKGALAVIASLPAELRGMLDVHDQSSCGNMLPQ